jgi:CheY-like chemotaxis protein
MSDTKRVMIVDDHAAVRRLVRSLFQAQGFDVCDAENGAEAVEKAQKLQPQSIVLDLSMPVMNGFEAARALKIPGVPLVMFTNNAGPALEREARAAGILAIVSRPDRPLDHSRDCAAQLEHNPVEPPAVNDGVSLESPEQKFCKLYSCCLLPLLSGFRLD